MDDHDAHATSGFCAHKGAPLFGHEQEYPAPWRPGAPVGRGLLSRGTHQPALLVADGAIEEAGADLRLLPAATPTPDCMTAILAQVYKAAAAAAAAAVAAAVAVAVAVAVAEDDDLGPALAACVQFALTFKAPWRSARRPRQQVVKLRVSLLDAE